MIWPLRPWWILLPTLSLSSITLRAYASSLKKTIGPRVDFGSTGRAFWPLLNLSSWRLSTCSLFGRRSGKEMKKEEGLAFKLTINLEGRLKAEEESADEWIDSEVCGISKRRVRPLRALCPNIYKQPWLHFSLRKHKDYWLWLFVCLRATRKMFEVIYVEEDVWSHVCRGRWVKPTLS